MLILIRTLFTVVASVSFLYFFWKKLKDDYSQSQIFTTGFYSLFGLSAGYVISHIYLPEHWFWLSFIGSTLGVLIGMKRFKMRLFETLEGFIVGALDILLVFGIYNLATKFNYIDLVGVIAVFFLMILFFYINKRYKRYVWYRSGKVGFSGLLVAGFYFVFRASFLLFSGIINRSNIAEAIFSGVLAFASFLALYNLSRKEV